MLVRPRASQVTSPLGVASSISHDTSVLTTTLAALCAAGFPGPDQSGWCRLKSPRARCSPSLDSKSRRSPKDDR